MEMCLRNASLHLLLCINSPSFQTSTLPYNLWTQIFIISCVYCSAPPDIFSHNTETTLNYSVLLCQNFFLFYNSVS